MTMRLLTTTMFVVLHGLAPPPSHAQTLQEARTVWASEPAEVPALATEVDLMLRSGALAPSYVQRDSYFPSRTHERLDQYHQGVRVFGGQLVWQKEAGLVLSITGNLYESIDVSTTPALTADEAATHALDAGAPGARNAGEVELLVLPLKERFALAYYLHTRGRGTLDAVFVDAHSGSVLLRYNDLRSQAVIGRAFGTWDDEKKMTAQMSGGTHRAVDVIRPFGIKTYDVGFDFDAWNAYATEFDRFLATDLDNIWRDGAVVDAHVYSGYAYDYYFKRHGRRGLDDRNTVAVNYVHILPRTAQFNNAFFDPVDTSLNYGDGDGITFAFFSSGLDVVAHELTHAVTEFTSDLVYLNESGALNEALSDIMAVSIEFMFEEPGRGRQRSEWNVGEDVFVNFGRVFRSFTNPNSVGDPDHYDVRCRPPVCDEDFDNGGVHINSSIANHAFYLMVEGGTNRVSGLTVQGLGSDEMEKIERIFFRAFAFFLVPSSGFSAAREATLRAARELYGAGGIEEQTVRQGWDAVGVR